MKVSIWIRFVGKNSEQNAIAFGGSRANVGGGGAKKLEILKTEYADNRFCWNSIGRWVFE